MEQLFQSLTGSIHTSEWLQNFYNQLEFQSLTGSIHTILYKAKIGAQDLFQSLTGSIHTHRRHQRRYYAVEVSIPHRFNSHSQCITPPPASYPFQSLTGSIHTGTLGAGIFFYSSVSIPHRFNSHRGKLDWKTKLTGCFNPSQVQFTRVFRAGNIGNYYQFQSLTGSIHTHPGWRIRIQEIPVSIPHRFNSHTLSLWFGLPSWWFQSLTGSIHTIRI